MSMKIIINDFLTLSIITFSESIQTNNEPKFRWGGNMMAKDVLCEVKNCEYWEQGNKCGAEAIYVVSHSGNTASDSRETDCKTFIPATEA